MKERRKRKENSERKGRLHLNKFHWHLVGFYSARLAPGRICGPAVSEERRAARSTPQQPAHVSGEVLRLALLWLYDPRPAVRLIKHKTEDPNYSRIRETARDRQGKRLSLSLSRMCRPIIDHTLPRPSTETLRE
ncbi:hypothetical protein DPX16_1441 [Anabarilius grahami]|uniref:Uncharacterized protein n=1 Tax=Anabarilius grahami TaxID=495550 RepID=A0A3N0YKX0_ANAGA|nr:hypothetical protein DPX16_1441 [Anabarilius grahami]